MAIFQVLEAVATYTSAYKYKLFNKNIYLIIKYIFYYILIIFIKYILIYNLNYNYIYSSSTCIYRYIFRKPKSRVFLIKMPI